MLVCPYCDTVEKAVEETSHCVLLLIEQEDIQEEGRPKVRTVFLKEHSEAPPSPEVMEEATKLLFGNTGSGMIEETEVAGHWGIKLIPMKWKGEGRLYQDRTP